MIRSPKPDPSVRAVELELATLRNIEALLGHAINLLHDAEKFAERIGYVVGPLIKANGEMLGFCGLKRVNAPGASCPGEHEIGWRLRESAWGQGIAKEAAIASLDLAFGRFAAPHVVALTVPGNRGSWGLMERLGMTRREDLDYIDPRFGPELNPTIVYRLDAADWSAARAAL